MVHRFTVSAIFPATQGEIYAGWLTSKTHAAFTGGARARVSDKPGGSFVAWDGYISGKNLEVVPGERIVQDWRTEDFGENDPDSRIEITLAAVAGGTKLTLKHSNIPDSNQGYKDGWKTSYFQPMADYFASRRAR